MMKQTLIVSLILAVAGIGYGFAGGTGQPGDPWIITSEAHLAAVNNDLEAHYELGGNINLAGINYTAAVIAPYDDDPEVEVDDQPEFLGSFDGKGYTLSNLVINNNAATHIGLFGRIGDGGVVSNVALASVDVTGFYRTGALAGYAGEGSTVTGCTVTGTITGIDERIGGLLGDAYIATIADCNTDVTVTGLGRVGGLIGQSSTDVTIDNCHTSGMIYATDHSAGGLLGRNYYGDSFTDCTSSCTVIADGQRAGGLVGWSSGATYENCSASGNVTGGNYTGGLIGDFFAGSASDCSATGTVVQTAGERAGGLFGHLNQSEAHACWATGAVTGIGRVGGLSGDFYHGKVTNSWASGNVEAIGDPGYSATEFMPAGGLTGQFHTSVAINCYATGNVKGVTRVGGLFGNSHNSHTYDSWAEGNVEATGDGSIAYPNDARYAGGLVGQNHTGSITRSYATGNVSGSVRRIGGLVGNSYRAVITHSWASGAVTATALEAGGFIGFNSSSVVRNCFSTGTASGVGAVGGFVGQNAGNIGTIADSYATGDVVSDYLTPAFNGEDNGGFVGINDALIQRCYSTGDANTALDPYGDLYFSSGFVGWVSGTGSIEYSFFDRETSGVNAGSDMMGVPGLFTAQMQTLSTFTSIGWDFYGEAGDDDFWYMAAGDYPKVWRLDSAYTAPFASGDGTAASPYTVSDLYQLREVNYHPASHFVMLNDVDAGSLELEHALIAPMLIDFRLWYDHVWFAGVAFAGVFDGDNNVIWNVTIDHDNSDRASVGTFGRITRGGVVKNLGVENANIQSRPARRTGGLAGSALGATISNCYVTGVVGGDDQSGGLVGEQLGGLIEECWTNVQLNCSLQGGGLVGRMRNANESPGTNPNMLDIPRVINSYALGNVYHSARVIDAPTAAASRVGGLVGYAHARGRIEGSHATGNVTLDSQATAWTSGGLVGVVEMAFTIDNCWASGHVSGDQRVGGLVGYLNDSFLTNSYAQGNVSNSPAPGRNLTRVGGLVGAQDRSVIANCYAIGDVVGYNERVGGLVGNSYDTNLTGNDDGLIPGRGIYDSHATGNVTCMGTSTGNDYVGGLVGQHHTTYIVNCYATGNVVSHGGQQRVGGLVGNCYRGYIADSYATGNVTSNSDETGGFVGNMHGYTTDDTGVIDNCYAVGNVEGKTFVGGFAGRAITDSSTITASFSTGNAKGTGSEVGGFIGRMSGGSFVVNCYSTGSATSDDDRVGGFVGGTWGTAINCYSTGTATVTTEGGSVGGFVGYIDEDSLPVEACFWDTETSGLDTSAGDLGIGKTTAQMMTLSTFTTAGWDFAGVWMMRDGCTYPKLAWQEFAAGDVNFSGTVSIDDLQILAEYWLQSGVSLCGDLDGDGTVDLVDFAMLASTWLTE